MYILLQYAWPELLVSIKVCVSLLHLNGTLSCWSTGVIAGYDDLFLLSFANSHVFLNHESQSSGKNHFGQFQVRGLWALLLKCVVSPVREPYFYLWGATNANRNRLYILGISLTTMANNFNLGYSYLVLAVLLGGFWLLKEVLSA